MPVGVNLVANSWKACYVAAHSPATAMVIGTGIGQITSSEAASIVAGDVIELSATVTPNADGSAPSSTGINTFADSMISDKLNTLQAQLKYFGYTQ